jgi:HK97 family phage portal protein
MFLSKIRASADDRSVYGNFWFEPVGMRTASGARVTTDRAMTLPVVFACVRVIAESFAVLPARIYEVKNGKRQRLNSHWLLKLLKRPNPFQTGFEWREMMQAHLALRGNAFNEIQTDRRGNITAFMPLHPDRMKIERIGTESDFDYRYVYTKQDGTVVRFARDEIWHIRGLSGDGIMGISVLSAAREAIGLGLAAQEYGARFFQNDAKPSLWVKMPGNFKDKGQREQFRESLQEAQTGMNRHKIAVMEYGMELQSLGLTNKDSQFLEARNFQVGDIARMMRVPPHKVGDLSKATFSNIEQQSIEFVTDTMTSWAERWESSIEVNLFGADEDGVEIDFDFKRLLRGDMATRSLYYHNGIVDGWLLRSDARDEEGFEPVSGLNKPLMPLNMVPLDENGEPENSAPAAPMIDRGDSSAKRMIALIEGNARRMARRLASGDTVPARVLAESLAIDEEAAGEWLSNNGPAADENDLAASLLELAI